MASVGHDELARLWWVSRRTVIRDIEKLRAAGLIAVARPARRGRVAAYRLEQAAFVALAAPLSHAMAPDLAARIANNGDAEAPPDSAAGLGAARTVVALFPNAAPHGAGPDASPDASPLGPGQALWRRIVTQIGEVAAPVALARWLSPLVGEGVRDGALILRAPSPIHAGYVTRTYGEKLGRVAAALGSVKLRIVG